MSDNDVEFEDEKSWLHREHARVAAYLDGEGVAHAGVASEPAWYVHEVIAVWAVASIASPGRVGWWAFSGDIPTDYIGSAGIGDARDALAAIAARWRADADRMRAGHEPDGVTFGRRAEWTALAPMLAARATHLAEWARDDALWS
jgi:Domain of unknown function (DUF4826)